MKAVGARVQQRSGIPFSLPTGAHFSDDGPCLEAGEPHALASAGVSTVAET